MSEDNRPQHHDRLPLAGRRGFLATALSAAAVGAAPEAAAAEDVKGRNAVVNPRLSSFAGGTAGGWAVLSMTAVAGDGLSAVERVDVVEGVEVAAADGV
ncbi:MAG: hypothetical protein K2V38_06665, partial [Gemmataceae bacterium]|nr:hypothetical protein [Gemmataceae bacterium]